MRVKGADTISRALLKVRDQYGGAVSGMRKALLSNENPMPITGSEIINSFQVQGLATAATGAVIGAGYAALSGGSMIEGAKQGAFYGGAWGTFSHMNASRALAARYLGIEAKGFGGGFRAMGQVRDMSLDARAARFRQADSALSAKIANAKSLARQIESGAITGGDARNALNRLRAMAGEIADYAPTPEVRRVFTGSVEADINRLSERFR